MRAPSGLTYTVADPVTVIVPAGSAAVPAAAVRARAARDNGRGGPAVGPDVKLTPGRRQGRRRPGRTAAHGLGHLPADRHSGPEPGPDPGDPARVLGRVP